MSKKTQSIISITIGFVAGVVVGAVGFWALMPRPFIVRIGTMGDAVDYAPCMVAKYHGWFKQSFGQFGVDDVQYISFQQLSALNESLGAKRIDVVFEADGVRLE